MRICGQHPGRMSRVGMEGGHFYVFSFLHVSEHSKQFLSSAYVVSPGPASQKFCLFFFHLISILVGCKGWGVIFMSLVFCMFQSILNVYAFLAFLGGRN